jgi:hypothetical protein
MHHRIEPEFARTTRPLDAPFESKSEDVRDQQPDAAVPALVPKFEPDMPEPVAPEPVVDGLFRFDPLLRVDPVPDVGGV